MATTLSQYITQVQYLLHDATGVFYTQSQLTTYINQARERVVRDTGALRTIQTTTVPTSPTAGGQAPVLWTANTAVTVGQQLVSNIYIYIVTTAGTTGSTAPPYPGSSSSNYSGNVYPPSTPFLDGTAYIQYVGNAEQINWVVLPSGLQTLDVINVNLYWGNTRIPLRYLPWTQFNAELRFWQNYIGRPICFTQYGQGSLIIAPVPDNIYTVDIDTVILPTALVNLSDTDSINDPYNDPVPFYAAYLAKYYEQSFGEAEIYKQEYQKHVQAVLVAISTRRMPTPYSNPF
jgi:hypothetical protein